MNTELQQKHLPTQREVFILWVLFLCNYETKQPESKNGKKNYCKACHRHIDGFSIFCYDCQHI